MNPCSIRFMIEAQKSVLNRVIKWQVRTDLTLALLFNVRFIIASSRQKVTPLKDIQASLCSFLRVSEGTARRIKS